MVDINILYIILSVILAVASVVFASLWIKTKVAFRAFAELAMAISDALEDDKITDTELANIVRKGKSVWIATRGLI